jgi:hypothetical protein
MIKKKSLIILSKLFYCHPQTPSKINNQDTTRIECVTDLPIVIGIYAPSELYQLFNKE